MITYLRICGHGRTPVLLLMATMAGALAIGFRLARANGTKAKLSVTGNSVLSSPRDLATPESGSPGSTAKAPYGNSTHPQPTGPQRGQPPSSGEILLKLKKGSRAATVFNQASKAKQANVKSALEDSPLGPVLKKHGINALKPAFRVHSLTDYRPRQPKHVADMVKLEAQFASRRDDLFRWYRVTLGSNAMPQDAVATLRSTPDVEWAEASYDYHLAAVIQPPITGLPDSTTDPDIDSQWHLFECGIQAGWNYMKELGSHPGGSRDVVVAVIDTGIDATHEDLIGNMWINPAEIPNNGIDDDENGFVDDVHGCSVVSDARSHSGDSSDYNGHGTHVAGIIAAQAYNHRGGVGVAFNVQVMAVRAAQYSGVLNSADIAEGILYAVDHGAEVINMSFGGYQPSQIMMDALEMALSQTLLVAAAGNHGLDRRENPCYPAAYWFVHGVMAGESGARTAYFSNTGYDVLAPGVNIHSTLPGNQYAGWSGTSMAAPVVSGIAACLRSFFWQREIYSSRFLMGGIWASANDDEFGPSGSVNLYRALTELPTPGVVVQKTWLFDDHAIDPRNDADKRVDSGEILHLAIEVINRSGSASNVIATLRAHAQGAVLDDPYVTMVVPMVDYGNIGPFNTKDNDFIYNNEGIITGVEQPFVFTVASNCPNDHVIPFELTTTFYDAWNPTNTTPFTRISRFEYIVQRGKNIPRVISTNLDLTADEYWIVSGPVLIEPGARLTIHPGTYVQWGAVSDDPYNPGPQSGNMVVRGSLQVTGTVDRPVQFFPSYLVGGQLTRITVDGGQADLRYVKVVNPYLSGLRTIDHAYFQWDYGESVVDAQLIQASTFHKFRGGGMIRGHFVTCLFDAGWLQESRPPRWHNGAGWVRSKGSINCVYLQDNENTRPLPTLGICAAPQF
jgi:hypothetical protein